MTIINKINKILLCDRKPIKFDDTKKYINFINKLFKTDYSTAYNLYTKKITFFRGTNFTYPAYIIDRSDQEDRVSAYTQNFYNILFSDYLDSWRKYPRRSKSIIMSTDYSKANGYGGIESTYIVFPKNDAFIGICPKDDIWDSFNISSKIINLNLFNVAIIELLDSLDVSFDTFLTMPFENILNKIDIFYLNNYAKNLIGIMQNADQTKINNFYDLFNEILNPEKNNFQLKKIEEINKIQPNVEIWTDSKCLLINMNLALSIDNYLLSNNKPPMFDI